MNRHFLAIAAGAVSLSVASLAGASVNPITQSFEFDLNRAATPTAPHRVAAGESDPLHIGIRAVLEQMADKKPTNPDPVYATFTRDLNRAATPTAPHRATAGESDPLHDGIRAVLEQMYAGQVRDPGIARFVVDPAPFDSRG